MFITFSGVKSEAPSSSGEIKNYRFRSDVPSPPSYTAVGGPASLLPKRKPLSEEEIEAIMVCTCSQVCHLQMLANKLYNLDNLFVQTSKLSYVKVTSVDFS